MERNQLCGYQVHKIHAKLEEIRILVAYHASGVEKEVVFLICSQMNEPVTR